MHQLVLAHACFGFAGNKGPKRKEGFALRSDEEGFSAYNKQPLNSLILMSIVGLKTPR